MKNEKDTEVALDFGDGFKFVRLISENAYKREAYLMQHYIAYDKDAEVYSLRDENNIPHVTIEKNRQIKGKCNNDIIHPRYIAYVIRFIDHIGMKVSDTDMKYLGYVDITELLKAEPDLDLGGYLFRGKYFPRNKYKSIKKNGKPFQSPLMWEIFGLVDEREGEFLFQYFPSLDEEKEKSPQKTPKNRETLAAKKFKALIGEDYNTITGYNCNTLVGKNYNTISGNIFNTIIGCDGNTIAGHFENILAGRYRNTIAGSVRNTMAGQDENVIVGRNKNLLAGHDSNIIAGRNDNIIVMTGANNVAIGCNDTIIRGKRGNAMIFIHHNENEVIATKTAIIDGEKFKEDTFYYFDGENIQEVSKAYDLTSETRNEIKRLTNIASQIKSFYEEDEADE